MIERYWNEMFGEFKIGDQKFLIPGLEEPLMSPDFINRNIVGNYPGAKLQSYKLCEFSKITELQIGQVKSASLCEEIHSERFWEYQMNHNQDAYGFLQKLLTFLVNHQKPHYHFYLENSGEIIASMLTGISNTTAFFFNLSVRSDFRKTGKARELLLGARSMLHDKEAFYWTKHTWLTLNADKVQDYCIIE